MRLPHALLAASLCVLSERGREPAIPPVAPATSSALRFEANVGQWGERARFRARARGTTLFVTDDAMVVTAGHGFVEIGIVGAQPSQPRGTDELPGKTHYFLGRDPSRWRTNVPSFGGVRARWRPGVDVAWHAGDGGIEYDFEVSPGVDATTLALDVRGATSIEVRDDGALAIGTVDGTLVQKPPRVLQAGRELRARWIVSDDDRVRFDLDGYDERESVLVDPVIVYSSYLGGSGDELDAQIAADASGNTYVTGGTESSDFPTKNAVQPSLAASGRDVFVTKLDPSGALVYSTYLGGPAEDVGADIAVDASGKAHVTGWSFGGFPVKNAFQPTIAGVDDAILVELDPSGSLVSSTYLGGTDSDKGRGVALDATGNVYIVGVTASSDLPTKGAFQASNGGSDDLFLAKFVPSGASLVYSTYVGGSKGDEPNDLAIDASGNAYATGNTSSTDFPMKSALQPTMKGGDDAFVMELGAAGSSLVFSTFLGGSDTEIGWGIGLDASANAYVAGETFSSDFPTKNALRPKAQLGEAFVTVFGSSGTTLVYSTFLGGENNDTARAIAVDASGHAYVAGVTGSTSFPTVRPFQQQPSGINGDAFLTQIRPDGAALVFSSYVGGSDQDIITGVALGKNENTHVTGQTGSKDFPTHGAFQTTFGGANLDDFVLVVSDPQLPTGSACKDDASCASGFCADGVCCDTACKEQCAACDLPGKVGTCSAAFGAPHGMRPACADIAGCASACDGVATNICTCQSSCSDDHTAHGADGTFKDCSPYVCDPAAGSCKTECVTTRDCIAPDVCDGTGKCVPLPTSGNGCACNQTGALSLWPSSLFASMLGMLLARRRRRWRRRP